jgi:hypothetical protein
MASKLIMKAQGMNGALLLMNDRLIIQRPGLLNLIRYGKNATREIPLAAISEVIFTAPTWVTVGEIEIVRAGSSRDERNEKLNANSLRFARRKVKEFTAIKEKLFEMMNQNGRR